MNTLASAIEISDNENRTAKLEKIKTETVKSQKELAIKYAEKAVETLAEIMTDAELPAGSRVSAAKEILDRAFGKPIQQVETNNKLDSDMLDMLENQFSERLEKARERQLAVLKERGIID
jgi:hypothetical protein